MPNQIAVEKTIFEELQEVRYELSKMQLKKSGYNKHLGFNYVELSDHLGKTTELLYKHGLFTAFNIGYDSNGVEIATMDVYKGNQSYRFQIPTAEVPNMAGIQSLGAKATYLRRYLYNHVLDLAIPDEVDASLDENSGKAKIEEKKATPKQIEMIKGLYDAENIGKMLEYYNIQSLEELPLKTASEVIKRKQK